MYSIQTRRLGYDGSYCFFFHQSLKFCQSALASSYILFSASCVLVSFANIFRWIHIAAGIVINFSGVHGSQSIASQAAEAAVYQFDIPNNNMAEPIQAQPLININGIKYAIRNRQLKNGFRYIHILFRTGCFCLFSSILNTPLSMSYV
jgi:hypothetical protein